MSRMDRAGTMGLSNFQSFSDKDKMEISRRDTLNRYQLVPLTKGQSFALSPKFMDQIIFVTDQNARKELPFKVEEKPMPVWKLL